MRTAGGPQYAEHDLRYALLTVKRTALVALRDSRRIDDAVLRRVQEGIDAEEVRLRLRLAAYGRDHPPGTTRDGQG